MVAIRTSKDSGQITVVCDTGDDRGAILRRLTETFSSYPAVTIHPGISGSYISITISEDHLRELSAHEHVEYWDMAREAAGKAANYPTGE